MLCLTIFSILLPIGTQPQIESNYAFAELNSQSIKDDTEYSDGDENSSNTSTSEAKSKLNVKNPFGTVHDDNNNVKTNIIIPDIVEPDIPVAEPSSITGSEQIEAHSIKEVHANSVDKSSSSNTDNADVSVIVEKEKEGNPTTTKLSSADSQIGILKNHEDNNLNDINNIVSHDKPSTEISQSELGSQPKYKSYRDFIENSTSNSEDRINMTDDTQVPMLNSTHSQSGTVYGNINVTENSNTNNSDNTLLLEKRTSTESSSTSSSQSAQAESSNEIYGDFNGDGFDDLAIGVAFENLGSIEDAGGVEVIYGSSSGLSATSAHPDQFWTQDSTNIDDSAELEDQFGVSLAIGDFNADGFDDLAIGVGGEDVGSISGAGGVEVIYGSSTGLSATSAHADQFWTQDSTNIDNQAETGDFFGVSLTTGDFNADGKDDLAIGVLGEDLGSIIDAGGVEVIYGSSTGLSATAHADQFWTQASTDIDNSAETGDVFGASLTAGDFNSDGKDDLAIGVPNENLGSIVDAGVVEVIYGSSSGLSATSAHADQFWTQNSVNIDDSAEPGDVFGASLTTGDFNSDGKDDLAIGVPDENLGSIVDSGGVEVIYGSSTGLSATAHADQFWTQDSTDIGGSAELSDNFGRSLAIGDFNADGKDDLAIGLPGESIGSDLNLGAVQVIYGSSSGLSATLGHVNQFWTQDSPDINDIARPGDKFGSSLTTGDFNADGKDDLAIGVPDETVGPVVDASSNAGGVEVIYGSSTGLSATSAHADQFWTQDSLDIDNQAENEDLFGYSLA